MCCNAVREQRIMHVEVLFSDLISSIRPQHNRSSVLQMHDFSKIIGCGQLRMHLLFFGGISLESSVK